MPPLPRDRLASSKKQFFEDSLVNLTHFSRKASPFLTKLSMWPKGPPKRANRSPMATHRVPQAVQVLPEDTKWSPKSIQGMPEALHRHIREAKGEDIYQETLDQPPNRTLWYHCIPQTRLQHLDHIPNGRDAHNTHLRPTGSCVFLKCRNQFFPCAFKAHGFTIRCGEKLSAGPQPHISDVQSNDLHLAVLLVCFLAAIVHLHVKCNIVELRMCRGHPCMHRSRSPVCANLLGSP